MGTVAAEALADYRRERIYDVLKPPEPGLGLSLTLTVPGGELWLPLAVDAWLTTSATAANRAVFLQGLEADGAVIWRAPVPVVIPAGQSHSISWYPGAVVASVNTNAESSPIPSPPLPLFPGMALALQVSQIQAGDRLFAVVVYRELVRLRGKGAEVAYELEQERQRAELEAAARARAR